MATTPGLDQAAVGAPAALHAMPAATAAPIVDAYAHRAITVPTLVLALFLKQVPLYDTLRTAATDVGPGLAIPDTRASYQQLEHAIAATPSILAAPRTSLDAADAWVPAEVPRPAFTRSISSGYITSNGQRMWLTPSGEQEIHKITEQFGTWLNDRLAGRLTDGSPSPEQLTTALDHMARRMIPQDAHTGGPPVPEEPTLSSAR
jgi:hypothetical protein